MFQSTCRPEPRRPLASPSPRHPSSRRSPSLVASLLAGLLVLPVSAAEVVPAPAAPAPAVTTTATSAVPQRADDADALRERLAAIRLDVTVDRDLDAASAALDQLLLDALAAAPFDGAAALVAQVQISRAELALQRGRPDRAAAILRGDQSPASAAPDVWQAALADPAVAALLERVEEQLARGTTSLDDEFLEVVRTALAEQDWKTLEDLGTRAVPYLLALAEPASTQDVEQGWDPLTWVARLDRAAFLREGRRLVDSGELVQTGRLVGGLAWLRLPAEFWIRSEGRPSRLRSEDHAALFSVVMGDPALHTDGRTRNTMIVLLDWLTEFDGVPPETGRALARACLSLPDGQVRGIQAKLDSNPFRLESTREFHEILLGHADDPVRAEAAEALAAWPAGPALLAAATDRAPQVRYEVARALTVREVGVPVMKVSKVVGSDRVLTPVLGPLELDVLARLAADPDASVRRMAATALTESGGRAGVEPAVYRALADDDDLSVRQLMTGFRHEDLELVRQVLERLAGDGDPLVRGAVAARDDLPGELADALLADLAGDADPVVRRAVTERLKDQQPATLAAEIVRRLAADPDPQVRRQLAYLDHADDELEAEVLVALARDEDPAVLRSMDFRLYDELRTDRWLERADLWVQLVELRRDHPTLPLQDDVGPFERNGLTSPFVRSVPGQVAIHRWTLAGDDPDDWRLARKDMGGSSDNHAIGVRERFLAIYAELTDAELLQLLERYVQDGLIGRRWLLEHLVEAADRRVELATTLWRDEAQGLSVRLRAAGALAVARPDQTGELLPEVIELLSHRGLEGVLSREEYRAVSALFECLPREAALTLVEAMTAPDQSHDQLAFEASIAARGVRSLELQQEPRFVRSVLGRFALAVDESGHYRSLISGALSELDKHPELMPDGWLEELVRHPASHIYHRTRALFLIGSRRDPADMPFLAECLRAPWLSYDDGKTKVVEAARNAVVNQLSDEAAEALLAAAAEATTDETRTLLMDGVRTIQAYQDAKALWERRVAAGATREQTVARLVELIRSGTLDQRLQSIRALATLRAHDQLPLLIELLEDEHPAVAATARQTLDALHADPLPVDDG